MEFHGKLMHHVMENDGKKFEHVFSIHDGILFHGIPWKNKTFHHFPWKKLNFPSSSDGKNRTAWKI